MTNHLDTMRAWRLHGPRDVRLESVARPSPAAGEVLVRVRAAGICGSDLHYFRDGRCGAFVPTRPFILGHEFAGEVAGVGPGVDDALIGTRVAVDPSRACGRCRLCREGRYNLCPEMVYYGSASVVPPSDGSYAEYVVAPVANCAALPDTVSLAQGALAEPLSVAAHALNRSGGVAGRSVLITGGGTIGQMILLLARTYGAGLVAVSDPSDSARVFAKAGGATTLDPTDPEFDQAASALAPEGFEIVFEASGAAPALDQAMRLAAKGATVVQVGTLEDGTQAPLNALLTKELTYAASWRFAHVFARVIDLIASGQVNPDHLITHTFPFDDLPGALLAAEGTESVKVQLRLD